MKKISFLVLLACGMLHAQQDIKVEEQIRSIYSTALLKDRATLGWNIYPIKLEEDYRGH